MAAKRRRRRRFSGRFILTLGMLMLLVAAILTSLNFIEDGQAGEAAGNALEQLLRPNVTPGTRPGGPPPTLFRKNHPPPTSAASPSTPST